MKNAVDVAKFLLFLILLALPATADPVAPADIWVDDGDTIEVQGERIRLVGFDAPEMGSHAHCGIERMLAARAASRLRQLIRTAEDIDLQVVPCSCKPGTEGTRWCNYGRACGYLTIDGQDAGDVLVAEKLAHPLVCGEFSCPKRQSWCPSSPGYRTWSGPGVRFDLCRLRLTGVIGHAWRLIAAAL
jgi:endonuclease YncB( thermonuclease family)